jgi:PAS domain S-box-containing protein
MSEDFLNKQDEAFWAETPVEALGPILNAIGVAVFVIDVEEEDSYRIAFINKFYESSFEVSAASSVGLDVRSALPPDTAARVTANYRRCIASGRPEKYDEEILLESGLFYARTVLTPLHDSRGRIIRIIGTTIDITDRRDMELELEKARDRADDANRAKSSFMANMSHELRTPLNAVIGYSDLMRSEMFGPIGNEKYEEYVEDIRFAGQHLLDIVNDILDLSRVESGHSQLVQEMVSVSHLLESATTLARGGSKNGATEITIGNLLDGVAVLVDRKQIRQCLINLLANARKFTSTDGVIHISAELLDDGRLAFIVTDTGRGIAPEHLPQALAPFGRIDSEFDATTQGAGLGLPITKAFIEQHGGNLHLNSMPGIGTTVFLVLPRARVIYPGGWSAMPASTRSGLRFGIGGLKLTCNDVHDAEIRLDDIPDGAFLLDSRATVLRHNQFDVAGQPANTRDVVGEQLHRSLEPFAITDDFEHRLADACNGHNFSHVFSKAFDLRQRRKFLMELRPDRDPGQAWFFLHRT